MALHRTVAGAHRGNLEDERRPPTIAAAISHRGGDDRAAYGYAMQYLEKSDSLEKAQQGVQAAEPGAQGPRGERRGASAKRGCATVRGSRRWPRSSSPERPHGPWRGIAANSAAARNNSPNRLALVDSYRESHDSLTSRLDATDAREAAVKELLEGRVAAVRDIAATCYTYGEGERLSAKMREPTLSPAMLADVVRMADIYNDRASDAAAGSISGGPGQLRLRGARHRGILAPGDQRDARHDAQRRLYPQVETQAPHRRRPRGRRVSPLLRVMFRTAAGEGTHDMRTGRSSGKDTGHAVRTLP